MTRVLTISAILLLLLSVAAFVAAQSLTAPTAPITDWRFDTGPVIPPELTDYGRKFRAWSAASDYSLRAAVVFLLLAWAGGMVRGRRPSPAAKTGVPKPPTAAHPPRRSEGN